MFNRIFAIVIILLVPLFALRVSYRIEQIYQAEWQMMSVTPPADISDRMPVSNRLLLFCQKGGFETGADVCNWYNTVNHMQLGSTSALFLGGLLLIAIYIMGRRVKGDRRRLCDAFVPGLYGVFICLIFLTGIHGALIVAVLVYGGVAVTGGPGIYGTLAAVSVIGVTLFALIVLVRGMFMTVARAKIEIVGKRLTPEGSPRIWSYVSILAQRLGALPPDNLIVGLEPNFFVTEAAVKRPGGLYHGRTLYLSLPLCRILSEAELRAVIGHELGHFRGADTDYSQKFYPIYRGVKNSICALEQNRLGGPQGFVLLPAIAVLSLYMEAFEAAENAIGRERELIADQAGAEASDARAIGSSLLKLHAFLHYYESTRQRMRETLTVGNNVVNVSVMFSDYVKAEATPTHLVGLDDEKLAHPTDTHPPLAVRLDALGLSVLDLESAALDIAPGNKAIEVIDNYATIEEELTTLEKNFMAKTGEIQQRA